MPERGKVGILISGRGSNMVSLVEAMQRGEIAADPAVVLSNKSSAAGLERARQLGVSTEVVVSKGLRPRELHEQQVMEVLRRYEVDLVSSSRRWSTAPSSQAAPSISSTSSATTVRSSCSPSCPSRRTTTKSPCHAASSSRNTAPTSRRSGSTSVAVSRSKGAGSG